MMNHVNSRNCSVFDFSVIQQNKAVTCCSQSSTKSAPALCWQGRRLAILGQDRVRLNLVLRPSRFSPPTKIINGSENFKHKTPSYLDRPLTALVWFFVSYPRIHLEILRVLHSVSSGLRLILSTYGFQRRGKINHR